MKAELKQAWVEALRSGEYKQGYGRLVCLDNSKDCRYCCLGVLCSVTGVDFGKSNSTFRTIDGSFCDYLPKSLLDRLELPNDVQFQLAGLNDTGTTFNDIADKIEELL